MRGLILLVGLVALEPGLMRIHVVDAAHAGGELCAHHMKFEPMGFVEHVLVFDNTPNEEDFPALEKRDFVRFGDRPAHSNVEANVLERDSRRSAFNPGEIVKRDIFGHVDFDITFSGQIMGGSLPIISELNMSDKGESALLKRVNSSFSTVETNVGAQLPLGCIVGAFYKIFGRNVERDGCDNETDRKGRNNDGAKGSKEFIAGFYVTDKSFPVVVFFLILGPALGLLLGAFVSGWLGGGVLFGWFGLVLFLMTLGIWF